MGCMRSQKKPEIKSFKNMQYFKQNKDESFIFLDQEPWELCKYIKENTGSDSQSVLYVVLFVRYIYKIYPINCINNKVLHHLLDVSKNFPL